MPRRRLVTILSIVFLLILTAVGAYTMHTIRLHSLPIPHAIGALTLALPAIVGLTVESLTNNPLATRQQPGERKKPSRWHPFVLLFLFIAETVLATLAGTYISPESNLRCGLDDRWQDMFSKKNGDAIKKIQDALNCCGLHSTVDRAFPLPAKNTPLTTCMTRYDRNKSCFDGWRAEEEKVAGLMLMVVLLTALWKVFIVIVPWRTSNSWFASRFTQTQAQNGFVDVEDQENHQGNHHGSRQPLRVEYPSSGEQRGGEQRYLDQPHAEDAEDGDEERTTAPSEDLLGLEEDR